jgi:serine protease AprX
VRSSFIVLFALLGLTLVVSLSSAATPTTRVWIELPRATRLESLPSQLPSAPSPGPRALSRRLARGRPDRVEELARGPRAESVRQLRDLGIKILYVSRWLSSVSVEVDARQLRVLRQRFPTARLRPVRSWRRELPRETTLRQPLQRAKLTGIDYGPSLLQNQQIQTDQMHSLGFTGAGVRVLILDTGFLRTHVAFPKLKVIDEWDFIFGDSLTANEGVDVAKQHNHGTGVLGVLAGWAPGQLVGPAFDAEFLLAKTEKLDTETRVEEDNFVAALEWGEARGADMVTASLGYLDFPDEPDSFFYTPAELDGDTGITTRAMDDLVALGVVALSAIGNSGANGPSSLITPSDADSVLAIGSVRADSTVSYFSSRGPTADGRIKPDLMARGSLTTWAAADSTFAQAFGTSLATPLAAGAIALVLQAHPEWGPGQVMAALRSTASGATQPDNDMGWGILQARAASMDVEDPIFPYPFELESPADSASVATGPVAFVWRRSKDLQSAVTDYRIQISSSVDFSDTLATHPAGADTSRSLAFLPSGDFYWRVIATDAEQHQRPTLARLLSLSTATASAPLPAARWAHLEAPAPNPFNPRVSLRFRLEQSAEIEAEIYDVAGRRVRRLFAGSASPGVQEWIWEGVDDRLRAVGSGVYLLRVRAHGVDGSSWEASRRMALVR